MAPRIITRQQIEQVVDVPNLMASIEDVQIAKTVAKGK